MFLNIVSEVVASELEKFVIIYLGNIVVNDQTSQGHLQHLEIVLKTLRGKKLSRNLYKCGWF